MNNRTVKDIIEIKAQKRNDEEIKILIVEDNPDHALLARAALEKQTSWSVDVADSVESAVKLMKNENYRVVLTDYRLPDGDGIDLINFNECCPFVVMTSQGNEKIAVRALQKGAYNYVVKDKLFYELLPSVISKAIEKYDADQELLRLRSELEKENKRLAKANQKLRSLDEMKSNLISTVSHELRTPLTIIQSQTSLVFDEITGPINEGQHECLKSVLRNCIRLGALIDDLLNTSKLESGKMKLECSKINIKELLLELINDFKPKFQTKSQELYLEAPDNILPVLADKEKIIQVLTNLVGNAFKFTPEGGYVTIEVKQESDYVIVEVKDSGIGISEEDQKIIFEKFSQVKKEPGAGAKGTGLGLSIAKEIVELHAGDIWVKSQSGKGSTFSFSLHIYSSMAKFYVQLAENIKKAKRNGVTITLILMRIKYRNNNISYNETGIIRSISGLLEENIEKQMHRSSDKMLQYPQKDTFAILLESDEQGAMGYINRLRKSFSQELLDNMTVGYGITTWSDNLNPVQWVKDAENRMTVLKPEGVNIDKEIPSGEQENACSRR